MIAEGAAEFSLLHLLLVIGALIVAAAVFVVVRLRGPRGPKAPSRSLCPDEMRESPREDGRQAPVLVRDAEARGPSQKAVLLDRSLGGLRLLGDRVHSVGTVLSVRGPKSGKKAWLQVRVTHCLRSGARWEIGCQFVQKPTARQLKYL